MRGPIDERRRELEKKKEAFQFLRDVDDEKFYIHQKMTQATNPNVGQNLFEVLRMKKQNQNLRQEVHNHEPRIEAIAQVGGRLIDDNHPESAHFQVRSFPASWKI